MRASAIAAAIVVICSGCQGAAQRSRSHMARAQSKDRPHIITIWAKPGEATGPLQNPASFVVRAGVEIARRFPAPIDGHALMGELYALPAATGQWFVDGGSISIYADDHGGPGKTIWQQGLVITVPCKTMLGNEGCSIDQAYAQPFYIECDLRAGRYYWLSFVNDGQRSIYPPSLLALRSSRRDTVRRRWRIRKQGILTTRPEAVPAATLAANLQIVPRGVAVPRSTQPTLAAIKRHHAARRVTERYVEVWKKPIAKGSTGRRPASLVLDATTEIARRFRAPVSARGVMGEFYALPGRGSMTPIVMFVLEDDNGRPGGALASGATFVVAPELPKPGPPSTQSFCLRCQLEAGKRYWFSIAGEEPMFGDEPPRLLALKSSARDTLRLVMRVKPNCKELARVQGGLSVGLAAQLLLLPDGEEVKLPW